MIWNSYVKTLVVRVIRADVGRETCCVLRDLSHREARRFCVMYLVMVKELLR
jgi:hypothetical protein